MNKKDMFICVISKRRNTVNRKEREARMTVKWKKLIAIVLVASMFMSTQGIWIQAEELATEEQNTEFTGSSGKSESQYWEFDPQTETIYFYGSEVETYTCQSVEEKVRHVVFTDNISTVYISSSLVNFPNLEDVYISKSMRSFNSLVFAKSTKLKEYIVDPENPYYCSIDGNFYYNYNGQRDLIRYAIGKSEETFEVAEGTEIVSEDAFVGETDIKTLILAENTIKIYLPLRAGGAVNHIVVPNNECKFVYNANTKVNPDLTIYGYPGCVIQKQCMAYNINFKEIPLDKVESISVAVEPTQMSVMKGQPYVTEGMKLNVKYSDGTTRFVGCGYQVTGNDTSQVGTMHLNIIYGNAQTGIDVEVTEIPEDIHLTTDLSKEVKTVWDKENRQYNAIYYFDPQESGIYSIFTEGLENTHMVVSDNNGVSKSNDNAGAYNNAQVDMYMKKGEVYTICVSSEKSVSFYLKAKFVSEKEEDGITVTGKASKTYLDRGEKLNIKYTAKGMTDGQELYYGTEPGTLEKNVDGVWENVPVRSDCQMGEIKNYGVNANGNLSVPLEEYYGYLETAEYRYTHQVGSKYVGVKFNIFNINDIDSEMVLIKNRTKIVHIDTKEYEKTYYIKADITSKYTFYTKGAYDTYGTLRELNGWYRTSNDNSGEDENFKITATLKEGLTYALTIKTYTSSEKDIELVTEGVCVHKYVDEVVEPTCYERGYTRHICSLCSESYIDKYVEAQGHEYEESKKNATCTESGYILKVCRHCGSEIKEIINATGHNYEKIIIAPTVNQGGYTLQRCKKCKACFIVQQTKPLQPEQITKNNVTTKIKKLQAKKKSLKITWKKTKKISGYEIQISGKRNFKRVMKKTAGMTKGKITFKKLKAGKKYYVRVRTYKIIEGKKLYSGWSKIKSKTVKQ